MDNSFDAIVIGSGLGGLTAGALYARTGARVLLLERNAAFGGAATTYQRGTLTIEASLHETTHPATPGGDPKREVFDALDLYDDIELTPVDDFQEIRCALIGEPFVLPHGFDAVEADLTERFPHQRKNIRAFLRQVRRSLQLGAFRSPDHGLFWRAAHAAELPLDLWAILRDIRSSLSEVFERFFGDDEAIKFALAGNLPYFTDDPDDVWWLAYVFAQGGYLQGGGYYIKGGSQSLSDRLAEIIREAGGETLTRAPATCIELGPGGEVTGARYRASGDAEQVAYAPLVFANAAPHVIEGLLPNENRDAFMSPFRDRPLSISLLSATIGVDRRPAEFGFSSYSTVLIPDWMTKFSDFRKATGLLGDMPGERMPVMCVVDYSHIDSGLAEDGVFPVNIVCADRLENWQGLSDEDYRQRKDAWLGAIVRRLDAEWPGIADAVVESSIATARSMQQHLNTPGGAIYGFALSRPEEYPKGPPQTFETAIKGLWLSSAYAGGGGFTGAISAGAGAVRAVLSDRHS
jgi:phytoene dehydrogenase-like protein